MRPHLTIAQRLSETTGDAAPPQSVRTVTYRVQAMPIEVEFPTMYDMAQTLLAPTLIPGLPKEDNTTLGRSRQARINSRHSFYQAIEKTHPTLGKSCLLRAICEVAEVPLIASHTGFLGEIFDILLR